MRWPTGLVPRRNREPDMEIVFWIGPGPDHVKLGPVLSSVTENIASLLAEVLFTIRAVYVTEGLEIVCNHCFLFGRPWALRVIRMVAREGGIPDRKHLANRWDRLLSRLLLNLPQGELVRKAAATLP
jgi:hypothetical protein